MKRPGTMEAYENLVVEALGEIEDLKAAIEFDDDEMDSAAAFVHALESEVRDLHKRLGDGTYSFEDRDLPFMAVIAQQSLHFLPFKGLLELINETHRRRLDGGN